MAAWLERAQNRTILLRKIRMGQSFHGVSFGFYYCDGKKLNCAKSNTNFPHAVFTWPSCNKKTLEVTAAPLIAKGLTGVGEVFVV